MMISCPTPSQLASRFEGLLVNPEQHSDLAAHVECCSVCQARIEGLLEANDPPGGDAFLPAISGYEVLARLGRGGMGVVYRARHQKLNRLVAIKMIRSEIASPEQLRRFQIEAQAVARLAHPNIVQIYEVAEHDGLPYLALELVEGGSLADRLGNEPMAPRDAARILQSLAGAMAHAHARGIVHRDLKPGNVLLASPVASAPGGSRGADAIPLGKSRGANATPLVKITDFGLARPLEEGNRLTRTGAILGTPGYLAPEQADGLQAGQPADVYSLGVILYRLLAGCCPFESSSLSELLYQISHRPPPPLRGRAPGVPASLERLCLACLEKDSARRPTASELADKLDEFLESPHDSVIPPLPRRRRLLSVSVVTAVLLAWGLWWAMAGLARQFAKPLGAETVVPGAALNVNALRVKHFVGEEPVFRGELGNGSLAARFGDCVSVTVELSEPAYFYVIEFNFAGSEQLIWPGDPKGDGLPITAPTKRSHVRCPGGNNLIWLDEKKARSGLQVYVVAASRQPLPCYAQWKKQRGEVHWARRPPGKTVWLADPHVTSAMHLGLVERSKVRPMGKGPSLDALCRAMLAEGVETVKALAFPVLP